MRNLFYGLDSQPVDNLRHAFGFAGNADGASALGLRVHATAERDRSDRRSSRQIVLAFTKVARAPSSP